MPRILLSTTVRWPTAARLAGALAESGCRVETLSPADHPLAASRYPQVRHLYRPLRPLASLAAAIGSCAPDLIVACDDRAAAHLRALHAKASGEVRASIERSLGDPAGYGLLASRSGFVTAAREAGIAAPETVSVAGEETYEFALRLMGLPAVLKADGSWGGDGVAVLHAPRDATAAWARLAAPPSRLRSLVRAGRRRDAHHLADALAPPVPSLCLQRFVPGTPATTSFVCREGVVLAANHFDVVATSGAAGPASVVRRVDDPVMEEAARKLARRFGLSGLHGLDYVRDGAGTPHLIEINPRATQTSHLAFGPGHDLCAALAGAAASASRAISSDDVALFPQEWTRDRASRWLATAHHDVPWDDPRLVARCLGGQPSPVVHAG
ncbi:MAG TPA: ATP-grasp domain-containing protein [Rhizomicrobium sp.]|nr:ATP-grasp domain-containing protein [Rhizomicrobium sp.]